MLLIPKQHFSLNLSINNDTVSTKYMILKRDDFDFDIVNSRSAIAMSLGVPLMVCIHVYLNFFALPEHLHMLVTSKVITNSNMPNSLSRAIGIINSAKHFSKFIYESRVEPFLISNF